MKLGKLQAEFDKRDIRMKAVLKAVRIPASYDFDKAHPGIPTPVFANDDYGCCVIAGRAHQTLRFEKIEQDRILSITDDDVITEYLHETGGPDSGLVVSRSLKAWRTKGWWADGKAYQAKAYARINHKVLSEVRTSIYADVGVGIGFSVPASAMNQFNDGKPWEVVRRDGGSLGGHYVYLPAYDAKGFTCVTWGRRQRMSNAFFSKYVDEAWAIWDQINPAGKKKIINVAALEKALHKATA